MRRMIFAMAAMLLAIPLVALGAGKAADFPPGVFDDGNRYSLKDLEGKVVVLFFYEKDCPKCRGLIPERNKVVEQYKDKPVKFIAIAASDSLMEARAYAQGTNLQMPVFADALGLMERRYATKISLQNIYQFRIIGPTGDIQAFTMEPKDIDQALAGAKWKYKDKGFDPRLDPALDRFEWGQYAEGMRMLKPLLKNSKKDIAESAKKLYDAIKTEGEQWLTSADQAASSEKPVEAFDLYTKTATVFQGEDMAKKAADALKKLANNPAVKDELTARRMWDQLCAGSSQARPTQKAEVAEFAQTRAKK
jgi:thiol-disulfide isomerase/thioredoxin